MADWNYFNGGMHGWNDANGYHPANPMTQAYCWDCGPTHIEGFGKDAEAYRRQYGPISPTFEFVPAGHQGTGFRCAPWTIGMKCGGCGKEI